MATVEEIQEIANRGLQGQLPSEKKIVFDELVGRGVIVLPQTQEIAVPKISIEEKPKAVQFKESNVSIPQPERITPGTILEPALTLGSGAIAEPIAGLAGIFQAVNPFADQGAGADAVKTTRDLLTFKPMTPQGQKGLEGFASFPPVDWFVKLMEMGEKGLGEFGFQIAGPSGGAFGASIPTALLEAMGLASLKKLRLGKADFIDQSGRPTRELVEALDDAGIDFNDLTPEQLNELSGLKQGASVDEAARKARFEEQGIPFTKGDVSQDFKDISREQRLLSMIQDEKSGPLRQLKFEQSEAFIRHLDELLESMGVPDDSGSLMKGALEGRLKLLKKEKKALYQEFAETAPELQEIPVVTDTIVESIPDNKTIRRIRRLSESNVNAFEDLLIEFGLERDPAKLQGFLKSGGEVTPLNIGNYDDFRMAINQIEKADQTGAIKVLTGPVKSALDNEANLIDAAIQRSGKLADLNEGEGILKPLTEARGTVKQIKTEFSPDSIVGKLVGTKKDGVTPIIEASKALDKVIGNNSPIEHLERVLESLSKAGPDGLKAKRGIQGAVILRAIDEGLKAPTRKFQGIQTFNGNAFDKSLTKFGDDRLRLLFKDDPQSLAKIEKARKTAQDMTPPSDTTPKGSAPIILDALNRFGRMPGIAGVVDTVKFLVNAGADERAVARAVKANPNYSKTIQFIKKDMPNLAVVLGLGSAKKLMPKEEGE